MTNWIYSLESFIPFGGKVLDSSLHKEQEGYCILFFFLHLLLNSVELLAESMDTWQNIPV